VIPSVLPNKTTYSRKDYPANDGKYYQYGFLLTLIGAELLTSVCILDLNTQKAYSSNIITGIAIKGFSHPITKIIAGNKR
jgi:hypothetical protein